MSIYVAAESVLARHFPAEWQGLSRDAQEALALDLVDLSVSEDLTLGQSVAELKQRLTSGGNPEAGVLGRYGKSLLPQYNRNRQLLARLDEEGFDLSELTHEGVRARCSHCQVVSVQGKATHETGCPRAR
jgi:hypothetical protein